MKNLLDDLNPAQREAVEQTEGPLLVLAGAGSGKTRVLTYRVAYLTGHKGVSPNNILAVTFTNKAAREMKERISKLLPRGVVSPWVATIHSTCTRILRRHIDLLGFNPGFTIYDDDDQLSLIKGLMKELELPTLRFSPSAVKARIEWAKNNLIGEEEYGRESRDYMERVVAEVYEHYQRRLRDYGALDFSDLIMKAVELFTSFPDVLSHYQERFRYILVDEYQDTNHAQYRWLNLLASAHRNLCVVGDDDQSIYGWRGADIRNILEFEKDYPQAKVVRLERNYRSTQMILQAAGSVVGNNLGRKGKTLWTERKGGERISLYGCGDEREEAASILQVIKDLRREGGEGYGNFVILYRTNAQSRILEEEFRREAIPYIIVGGVRFYERREVKDILAYLRVIANPLDEVSLLRIINVPHRGIGEGTRLKIARYAQDHNLPFFEAMQRVDELKGLQTSYRRAVKGFVELITELQAESRNIPLPQLVERTINQTGYLPLLESQGTLEAQGRAENIKELLNAAKDFGERSPEPSLQSYLEEVSLITDIDSWNGTSQAVTLMTLHNAKGLEFPVVFICGLEEGLLPVVHSLDSPERLEEERRLFYVGLTRAKDRAILTYAKRRRRYEGSYGSPPSRFLQEIPKDLLERKSPSWGLTTREEGDLFPLPLKRGSVVRHPSWGEGVVMRSEGVGENLKLTVMFPGHRLKKILVKYADLEIISY